ncbi:MAG: hypothetical protein G01um10148_47 [Parcubacteria group bacterium Gr01-1014_8]|nr:MAG: hypothetical protein G01um10148_47 [Parcubacteria group bacterium Gr01-1014_8]
MQAKYGRALFAREQAIQIAEAGLEYYRWFLVHTPNVMLSGAGLETPVTYVVEDPEGGRVGEAAVTTTLNTACGVPQYANIASEGRADQNPVFKRTLIARYMRPSVAEYSHIVNQNVWAGSDRNITGPYHSNGGVRMDGTNNSDVTSSVSTWICGASFGCSPTNNNAAGVFGAGTGSPLWSYPVPQVSFEGIGSNFSALRGYAQLDGILLSGTTTRVDNVQQGGTYSSVAASDQRGYRLVFNSNGTVTIYRVTGTSGVWGYNGGHSPTWYMNYDIISTQVSLGTFTPPSDCAVIFVSAKTWIEGTVSGKITIVTADTGAYAPSVILNNNVNYATADGSTGLTVIAEDSILVPLVSPDQMTIRGIFVAQGGLFGRNYYTTSGSNQVPSAYDGYVQQSQLTTNGSVISNKRVGTKWLCGSPGVYCSGYNLRIDNYDRILAFAPPPFTPSASADYKFVLWREQ